MRTWIRARARMLAAGIGLLAASSLTGCWSTSPNPSPAYRSGNQNIPKTNLNSGVNTGNSMGAGNGQPVGTGTGMNNTGMAGSGITTRQSGAPVDPNAGRVGMTSGALAGSPGAAGGSPPYLNPPPNNVGGAQPIATSTSQGGIKAPTQPVSFAGVGAGPASPADLDPPPSANTRPPIPSVPAISAEGLDKPRNWQRKTPMLDVDTTPAISPTKPPMPLKLSDADPLAPPPNK
jgi:hypothetical protein